MSKLRLAGVQSLIVDGDLDGNYQRMESAVKEIVKKNVDFILFPELCLTGPDVNNIEKNATAYSAEIRKYVSDLSRQNEVWILPGTFYYAHRSEIRNRAEVFNPNGDLVAHYDKQFPWLPYEMTKPGNEITVVDIDGKVSAGISICYDMWFPEQVRDTIMKGAEIILHPSLTSTEDRKQELILSQAHAIMNQCYFIDINGAGVGVGESIIVGPEGEIISQAGKDEEILIVELDINQLRNVREVGTENVTLSWKHFTEGLEPT